MGTQIPVVEGGFGEKQKVILAETVAEIHDVETKYINKLINNNIERFGENDLIDCLSSSEELRNFAKENGLIRSNRTQNVFILSQRGYTKLVAMMDNSNDKKWDVMNNLIDDYFNMREKLREVVSIEQQKANLLLAVYNGGVEGVQATKQLVDIEAKKIAEPLLEKIEEDKPKVDRYESWINTDKTYTATQMVKLFKDSDITNASKLNIKLHELRLQYKQGRVWLPFAEVDKDLYELKVNKYGVQLRWTTRGVIKISEILNIELDREQLQ